MKTYKYIFLFIAVVSVAFSCQKPEIDGPLGTDETELNYEAVGGRKFVNVKAKGEWVASSGEPWIMISPANGRGNGVCEVIVDTTLVLDARKGSVNITEIDTHDITSLEINQKGYEYTIKLNKQEASVPDYERLEKRYVDVVVNSNILFDIVVPEGVSWVSVDDNASQKLNLDRGVRPRNAKVRFSWKVSSTPEKRLAEIKFVPKDKSVDIEEKFVLTQGAAPEITQSRGGDSLAVMGLARSIGKWEEYDTSLPMTEWSGIVLWDAEQIDDIRRLVADDKEHLLEDQKNLPDDNELKNLPEAEYLEAVAQSYVGRVRSVALSMFETNESIPQEVQYLRAAESVAFQSNTNTFLRSLSTGEYLNNLTQLRRLTVAAYGLTSLDLGITALKNLEYINLASNNFQKWPALLNAGNFPKLHCILFNANQRSVVYDLSNTTNSNLGGFMDETVAASENKTFWRKLLTWEKLDTLMLSVNYIQGQLPSDETLKNEFGIPEYTEADRADSLTARFIDLKLPRVLPNMKKFCVNYNRLAGDLPFWVLYHPCFDYWLPDSFIYNQEGSDKNGNKAGFSNEPISLENYSNVAGNAGSYYDIHPYKLEKK